MCRSSAWRGAGRGHGRPGRAGVESRHAGRRQRLTVTADGRSVRTRRSGCTGGPGCGRRPRGGRRRRNRGDVCVDLREGGLIQAARKWRVPCRNRVGVREVHQIGEEVLDRRRFCSWLRRGVHDGVGDVGHRVCRGIRVPVVDLVGPDRTRRVARGARGEVVAGCLEARRGGRKERAGGVQEVGVTETVEGRLGRVHHAEGRRGRGELWRDDEAAVGPAAHGLGLEGGE